MEIIENISNLPSLSDDAVHIWGLHVPDLISYFDCFYSVLSDDERWRIDRYRRETTRQSSMVARGALRILLSGYMGSSASKIVFRYNENGKPFVVQSHPSHMIAFNLSHSGDWVVLAFGLDRALGVDVEKIRLEKDIWPIARRSFSEEELALLRPQDQPQSLFFNIWTRKEAYLKAHGTGVFHGLNSFSVPIENGALPDVAERDGWHYYALEAGSKYTSAVVSDRAIAQLPCYALGEWDVR